VNESREAVEAAEALAAVPAFAGLTPLDRAKLAAFLEERWLDPGTVVFEAGGEGDALYIVRAGVAERRVAGSSIGTIRASEIFGELALLTDAPRSASVVALTPLHLWVLPRHRFQPLLRGEPELTFRLSAAISSELARTRRALGELQRELDTWVAERLEALGPEERELIEAAAVFRGLPLPVLARLAHVAPEQVVEWLVGLARRSPLVHQDQTGFEVPAAIRGALRRRLEADRRLPALAARLRTLAEELERDGYAEEAARGYAAAGAEADARRVLKGMPAEAKHGRILAEARSTRDEAAAPSEAPRRRALAPSREAWIALALVPSLFWLATPPEGLDPAGWRVLLTLVSAAVLFASDALPEAVVALALLGVWVVTGLVAPRVALEGFASQAWLLVLVILAVGVAVGNAGLLYRAALVALARTPATFAWRCFTLAVVGVLITPTLPNATSRMALAAPLVRELAEALGYEARGRAATGLALAALVGFGQMSALFLTGSSVGLLVHGLLEPAVRAEFGFAAWLGAALPLHLVLFGASMTAIVAGSHSVDTAKESGDRLALQRAVLGPMRRDERLCLAVLAGLIAGFLTESWHGIHGAWLGVGALLVLAAGRALDTGMLRTGVNWPFLVFFGVITSLAGVFAALGIDAWLAQVLSGPVQALAGGTVTFCLALTLAGFGLSFVVRWQAAAPLLTLIALPAGAGAGVHPFLVALIALVATQVWFLPYQSTVYLALYHGSGELFTHARARRVALLWGPLVLLSVLAATPVWRWMGLLR
jgi:CRP-like cAMP-binding protein/di/tricarboxylate transporter